MLTGISKRETPYPPQCVLGAPPDGTASMPLGPAQPERHMEGSINTPEIRSQHCHGSRMPRPSPNLNLMQANYVLTAPCTFTNSKSNNKKWTLVYTCQSKVRIVSSLYLCIQLGTYLKHSRCRIHSQ